MTVTVDVQWALQAKTLGRQGYRVLSCSNGDLSMENFTELIGRFSLGTLETLPQVSVSYLTSGSRPGRVHYLGMAIHEWAANVETDGGELLGRDDDGRPVAATAYFCVPYQALADAATGYLPLYQALRRVRFPLRGNGQLLRIAVSASPAVAAAAVNAFAMQSASRLLTGRPVCVLGAESATLEERLAFIEATAQLLPYGFRTRLTAATWVRPTHRDHRFRLFFSAQKRDAKTPDEVLYWQQPERTALTPQDDIAYTYYQWLTDTVGQLDILAKLAAPRSFSNEDILASLDEMGIQCVTSNVVQLAPSSEKSTEHGSGPRLQAPQRWWRRGGLDVEQILRDCAEYMRTPHPPNLNTVVARLKGQAKSANIGVELRSRCQQVIREEHLFRHEETLGDLEFRLRQALLAVAFTAPLSYADYCLIEDSCCLTGETAPAQSPDLPLLRLIMDKGLSDLRIRAVVYAQLPKEETRKPLDQWYTSAQVTSIELISAVAGPWYRPRHALYACATATDYISRVACEPYLIRRVLRGHGYLAHMLQAAGEGLPNTQVHILSRFLKTAYPDELTESDIREILTTDAHPPSPALLVAVLLRIPPRDTPMGQLAREAYISATTMAMGLRQDTQQHLARRLPFTKGRPSDPVIGDQAADTDQP